MTKRGGDISGSRRIYCHGDYGVEKSCGMKAVFKGRETGAVTLDFYDSRQVQRLIRKKELKQFGPLEQAVEDASSTIPAN